MLTLQRSFKLRPSIRLMSTSSLTTEKLSHRKCVRVCGRDANSFLQGLITNDINLLENQTSLYTHFLNVQGRILFDCLISKPKTESDVFFIDCDANLASMLAKHLTLYKIRRQVEVSTCGEEVQSWSILSSGSDAEGLLSSHESITASPDPRLPSQLGHRVLLSPSEHTELHKLLSSSTAGNEFYKRLRYTSGIAEGGEEIPLGKCFPLEYNLDQLNGVNFHKGCYIGQELTARTHHTGVVRKRILPIRFDSSDQQVNPGHIIINAAQKKVGEVRGVCSLDGGGGLALALLRVEDCLKATDLVIKETGVPVTMELPDWWSHVETKS